LAVQDAIESLIRPRPNSTQSPTSSLLRTASVVARSDDQRSLLVAVGPSPVIAAGRTRAAPSAIWIALDGALDPTPCFG
jgi:hypothetical protein